MVLHKAPNRSYLLRVLEVTEYGIEIRDLVKIFPLKPGSQDGVRALDGVDLRVNPGELFVILGPSGCGKSTLLRCVAGLEEPESGEILLGRRTVYSAARGESVPAQHRQIGMVFQNFALYPHMSVAENVGFGLKTRRVALPEVRQRVAEALRLVDMQELADRRPRQLSGGQQQRVALARAIAGKPEVLLFDEPLSNLDPLLRNAVRTDLKQLIMALRITSLFVTHDQEEAMIMGDRLAVMQKGRVEQIGTPEEVYRRPQTIFVAAFTGRPVTNLIEGVVDLYRGELLLVPIESRAQTLRLPPDLAEFHGQRITVHVRPEQVRIAQGEVSNVTSLRIENVLPEGGHSFVHFHLGGPYKPLVVRTDQTSVQKEEIGRSLSVTLDGGTVYSPETGRLIGAFGG